MSGLIRPCYGRQLIHWTLAPQTRTMNLKSKHFVTIPASSCSQWLMLESVTVVLLSSVKDLLFRPWLEIWEASSCSICTRLIRTGIKMAICCPDCRGPLRQQSLRSHYRVPKVSHCFPKVVSNLLPRPKVVPKLYQSCRKPVKNVPKLS